MNKYHINPETGEPGRCSAKIKCRFGENTQHFETLKDARNSFEKNNYVFTQKNKSYDELANAFKEKLTDNEIHALTEYAHQEYSEINESLWSDLDHKLVKDLDSAIAKAPRVEKELFRKPYLGHSREEILSKISALRLNEELEFKGFTSCSESMDAIVPMLKPTPFKTSFGTADDETDENVVFKWKSKAAAPVSIFSHMTQEQEWLLPRNVKAKVLSIETTEYSTMINPLGQELYSPAIRKFTIIECELL